MHNQPLGLDYMTKRQASAMHNIHMDNRQPNGMHNQPLGLDHRTNKATQWYEQSTS